MAKGDERGTGARAIAELFRSLQTGRTAAADEEGLRERKKRLMRQQISDTATMLFLERGFDEVKVADVAAACDVSEKTVYNYFPTKESLLFDRTDAIADQIREAVRDRGDGLSLAEAAHAAVASEFERLHGYWTTSDGASVLSVMRRFGDLVDDTPALRAAQHEMFERLTQVAALALAERAGVSPDDPEPQIAALALAGLWRVQFRSMRRHVATVASVDDLRTAVIDDVARAARVADAGLGSFDAALPRGGTKQGVREAAEAMNLARKQVVAAVRQARDAWHQVKVDFHGEHAADAQRVVNEAHRRAHDAAHARAEAKIEAKLEAAAARRAAAQARRQSPRVPPR